MFYYNNNKLNKEFLIFGSSQKSSLFLLQVGYVKNVHLFFWNSQKIGVCVSNPRLWCTRADLFLLI